MANALGKRYVCSECQAQVLIVKTGEGTLECHEKEMELLAPKPLPSSD